MKQNKSRIRIIIIVVTVLLIAAIGWLVVTPIFKEKPVTTNSTSDETANNNAGNGATKHLSIKEWGVKFSLTVDTADAYYDTKNSSSLDSMSLRSPSLDSEPHCKNDPGSVAAIFRVPKDANDDITVDKKYNETRDGKTIGDYFYFIQLGQSPCTNSEEKLLILQGVRNSFSTSGPTIEKMD